MGIKIMNILVACNRNYIYPTLVLFISLIVNHEEKIYFHLLYSELEEYEIIKFNNLCISHGAEFSSYFIDKEEFKDFDIKQENRILSIESYFRMLVGEILPTNIERILYLDTDIIVNKNISSFYNMNLGGGGYNRCL